jgi:tRNA threonylcarbamoyladenosine biosynthesis protein TsaB
MVKILALDTATEACSAALLMGDQLLERYELAPRRHAALILPMLESVLAEAGVGLGDLDALAFGRGPGAFTGVRIATGVAQGIGFAADLPVAPISTLAALARQIVTEHAVRGVATALDARMGEVYFARYLAGDDGEVRLDGEERVCTPSALDAVGSDGWVGAGSGWSTHAERLRYRLGISRWWPDVLPRAGHIAALGARAYRRGELVSAEQAVPVYLRDQVAVKSGGDDRLS